MSSHDEPPPTTGAPPPVTVDLYVRVPVPDTGTVAIDRLSALRINDCLEGFEVETVRGNVILDEGREGELPPPLQRWRRLATWSEDELEAAIEVETATTRTGRLVRKIVPPPLVAGVGIDGELECVFPCTDGEHTWTVTDFLDDYETGRELPTGRAVEARLA